jgi:exodeoxyribonuclease VII small subunit
MNDQAPAQPIHFEQALAELEAIVRTLEESAISLDETLAHYERGVQLLRHCQQQLEQAELRVLQLNTDANGDPILQPFEPGSRPLADTLTGSLADSATPPPSQPTRQPLQAGNGAGNGSASPRHRLSQPAPLEEGSTEDAPPF